MNPKPGVSHFTIWSVDGPSVQPADEAPWTKNRLGQVGPGSDECHWSHRANTIASSYSTGTSLGVSKHSMMSPYSAAVGRVGFFFVISVLVVA